MTEQQSSSDKNDILVTEANLAQAVQELRSWTVSIVETVYNDSVQNNKDRDELFEQFEKQLATLTTAYIEIASLVESIVSSIVNRSEEERDQFFNSLRDSRKHMLDVLKYSADQNDKNADKFVAYNPTSSDEPASDTVSD